MSLYINAQSYDKLGLCYKIYGPTEGFVPETVKQYSQDEYGVIWLATNIGLYTFDGTSFTQVKSEDQAINKILKNEILSLFHDNQGNLWIGGLKGIVKYESAKSKYFLVKNPLTDFSYFYSITQTKSGKMLTGCNYGVFEINDTLELKPFFSKNNIEYSMSVVFHDRHKNKTWFVNHNSITEVNCDKYTIVDKFYYSSDGSYTSNFQTAYEFSSRGNIWLGKYNGELYKINIQNKQIDKYDFKDLCKNPSAIVNYIYEDDEGSIWVAVDETGILKYNNVHNKFDYFLSPYDKSYKLPSLKINSLFKDREGSLWFNIKNNGLVVYNSQMDVFQNFEFEEYAKNSIVSSVLLDGQNLYVGSDGGGLHNFKINDYGYGKLQISNHKLVGENKDAILNIFKDKKGRIWVGSYRRGLGQIINHKLNFDEKLNKKLLKKDIRKIIEDENGDLWLVVHGAGVAKIELNTHSVINYQDLASPWTYDIKIDQEQTIWVSTNNGICRKKKTENKFSSFGTDAHLGGIENNKVNCLFVQDPSSVWVGTTKGLYKFDKKKEVFTTISNLPELLIDAEINNIQKADDGVLLIATNKGLVRYNASNSSYRIYKKIDGLLSENFILNSYSGGSNLCMFGTTKGLVTFREAEMGANVSLPVPILVDCKVKENNLFVGDGILKSNLNTTELLELEYSKNQIAFSFACPSFVLGKGKIFYEYRLLGLDSIWHKSSLNNSPVYSNLNPGLYIFQVKALDGFGHSPIKQIKIQVKSPFWLTIWFYIGIAILVILLIYLYVRYKTNSVNKLNKILEERIARRTAEILDKNQRLEISKQELEEANNDKNKLFSIIAHDLRGPVSSVSALSDIVQIDLVDIENKDIKKSVQMISVASKSAYLILENLLHWSRTSTGRLTLSPTWIDLNLLISEVESHLNYQLFNKEMLIYKSIGSYTVFVDLDMMITVLRNFVNNAIKFSYTKSQIDIRILENENKSFVLQIRDYGVGLSIENQERNFNKTNKKVEYGTSGEKGTGLGLLICDELLSKHGFEWSMTNAEIGTGCLVNIHIPKTCIKEVENINEIIKGDEHSIQENTNKNSEVILNRQSILIVDDSEVARISLKRLLEKDFVIEEAVNGKDALEYLNKNLPELIICDVEMPEMNGFEFSEAMRQNTKFKHIPLLFLTSNYSDEQIMKGLELGAEDYLNKTYNLNILKLKITSLLQNRKTIRKKYSLDDKEALEEIAGNSVDSQFLKKIYALVEENISNSNYGVEELSLSMGMHRSKLSRKFSSLIGDSPQEFMKAFRLKKAAQMLLVSGKSVSEIAYDCGFSDPKYFSKSFKAHFGCLPSEYKLNINLSV